MEDEKRVFRSVWLLLCGFCVAAVAVLVLCMTGELVYNGEVQYPRVSVRDRDGNELSGVEIIYNGGDAIISKYVGEYTLSVRVSGNYYIDSSCLTTIKYKIVADAEGKGEYKIIDIEITGSYKKNYNVGEKFENVGMIVNDIYGRKQRGDIRLRVHAGRVARGG